MRPSTPTPPPKPASTPSATTAATTAATPAPRTAAPHSAQPPAIAAPVLPAWRPVSRRQAGGLLLLTLVTVLGLVYVLQRPHQQLVAAKAAQHAAACRSAAAASRPVDCPGALMPVTLLPPAR